MYNTRIPLQKVVHNSGAIPYSVAEFPEESEKNIKIDFVYYNDALCEISLLNKKAKEALKRIKMIGMSKRSTLNATGINLSPVTNDGEYRKLFNKLPSVFEDSMLEHKFGGTCRIFCSFEGDKCYVIAITVNHFETDKHRK